MATLLAAILLANMTVTAAMNAFRLPPQALTLLYPAFVVVLWRAGRPRFIRAARCRTPPISLFMCVVAFCLLTVPRFGYLLEWIPGNAVLAQFDDYGRLAELASLTLSPAWPPLHPANQDYLLSHYFSALLPMAWLKLTFAFLTLKDCIFLGNALYHALMLSTLLTVARHWLPSPLRVSAFVFLCTLFGGLDWLFSAGLPFSHAERWAYDLFGIRRELSSVYTALFWVVHHMASVFCLVLAGFYATRVRAPSLLTGALLLASVYHSPFVALGASFCFWRELIGQASRLIRSRQILYLLPFALLLAPAFHGRLEGRSLWWAPAGNPALYLASAAVIELAFIPLAIPLYWRHLTAAPRRWLAGAFVYLLLAWGIESVGFNNFCMRGLLMPTLVLFFTTARYAPEAVFRSAPALVLMALTGYGTLRAAAWNTYQPLQFSNWYWHDPHRVPLRYRNLARDRRVRYYLPAPEDRFGMSKYNAEKLIRSLPVEEMDLPERELARLPVPGPIR